MLRQLPAGYSTQAAFIKHLGDRRVEFYRAYGPNQRLDPEQSFWAEIGPNGQRTISFAEAKSRVRGLGFADFSAPSAGATRLSEWR